MGRYALHLTSHQVDRTMIVQTRRIGATETTATSPCPPPQNHTFGQRQDRVDT